MRKKVILSYVLAIALIAVQVALLVMAMSECGMGWKIALTICCLPIVGSLYPIYFADGEDKLTAVCGFSCLTGGIAWTFLGIQLLSLTLLGDSITSTPFKLISVYMLIWFGLFAMTSVIKSKNIPTKSEIAAYALFCLSVAAILVSTVVDFNALVKTLIFISVLVSSGAIVFFVMIRFLSWIITSIHNFFARN